MKAAIIGGDKRMLYAARALLDKGWSAALCGFSAVLGDEPPLDAAIRNADCVILPAPCLRDGAIHAPFSRERISFDTITELSGERPIFCGMPPKTLHSCGHVINYAQHPLFSYRNAVLTAEGAIGEIIRLYEGAIFRARILVAGYGRIGDLLALRLHSLGAHVCVAARRREARERAGAAGMDTVDFSSIENKPCDILVNTVPSLVFDASRLSRMTPLSLVIDLASLPGGVDFDYLQAHDIPVYHALALPGKCAPKAAGEIIAQTVLTIIGEENLG